MWRVHLCTLAVVALCGSGRGSSAVKKEPSTKELHPKITYQPGCDSKTTAVDCISNWEELFCILQKEAKEKGTLVLPSWSPPLLLIHVHKYARNSSDLYNSSSYCQLSEPDDECAMIAAYSQSIFSVYPAALLLSLGRIFEVSTKFQYWLSITIVEVSWILPLPFCSRHGPDITEHVHELMKSASDSNHPADNYIMTFSAERTREYSTLNAIILYSLIICSSSAILLLLCWHSKRYPLHRQRSLSSVSKSLLFSTMFQSWMWFMYLYGYQFRGLSVFKDFLHSRNAVISTAYMPFVDIGYCAFVIMGVFYLVEFPFLLWHISTKVMAVDRQGLNRRQCMMNMLKSVGCAGMVLFVQVIAWYLIHFLIGLLSYPLFIIVALGAYLFMLIFLTASTALLLLPCLTQCRRCPQQSIPIMFLALIALICGGFIILLSHVGEGKWNTSYDADQIISGLFASGILALLVYTVKSVLTPYMLASDSQAGRDESDEQLLPSAEISP